ncbi:MAG: translation elongation factor Ts [Bacteroidetes bacterium]|nr:translation elongation factor Ts [Bacteroidota bacterium]MBU1719767.1 translation elongation factor Ts [Bacteroidota bacterium]
MSVTAAEVNNLRKTTGAGIMDCKNALVEADGDFEKAIEILRKKGQKVANKRSDRDAAEGAVIAKVSADQKNGVILMLNCETDFVGKNDEFVNFTHSLVDLAVENNHQNLDALLASQLNGLAVAERINEMVGKIGEKIEVGAFAAFSAARVVAYIHPGNRLASLVGFNISGYPNENEVVKQIAMQIAAMAPIAVDTGDVSAEILEKEKEIAMEVARNEGKAEEMLERIATGRVAKFLQESTLMNQTCISDSKKTVAQYLKEVNADLKVTEFRRVMLSA